MLSNYVLSANPGVQTDVVSAVLRIKRVPTIIEPNTEDNEAYFFDHKNCICGFQIIIEYLDERFPAPGVLPVEPLDRAKTRMLSCGLIKALDNKEALDNILSEYASYYQHSAYLFNSIKPTILDIIIYAVGQHRPEFQRLRSFIDRQYPNGLYDTRNEDDEEEDDLEGFGWGQIEG